jgi:hypothetical protein
MTKVVSDIIVSPCRILYNPTSGSGSLPAITVAAGGAWPAGWVEMGYTESPLSMEYSFDKVDWDIQESLAPVGSTKTNEKLTFETSLAEFDVPQMQIAFSASGSSSGSSGSATSQVLSMGNNASMTDYAWGFEGKTIKAGVALPIRIYVWKGVATSPGKLEFGKKSQTGIPLKVEAHADMTQAANGQLWRIEKVTAQ